MVGCRPKYSHDEIHIFTAKTSTLSYQSLSLRWVYSSDAVKRRTRRHTMCRCHVKYFAPLNSSRLGHVGKIIN